MADQSFDSIEKLSAHIKGIFGADTRTALIYAFNATGKTRLAGTFNDDSESDEITTIVYNAFFEDMFTWDNEIYELRFQSEYSWILRTIRDEGLHTKIVDAYRRYSTSHTDPVLDFNEGTVGFPVVSEDVSLSENIKISRAEESLLVWSIFYVILDHVIDILDEKEPDRSTDIFNNLRYVVIDDPVSSMDDTRIVSLAVDIAEVTKRLTNRGVRVLTMTHHALFYNVIANLLPKKYKNKSDAYKRLSLAKSSQELVIKNEGDSPFGYHLFTKKLLQEAVDSGNIERYHFNMFRALLEKTANFLGCSGWGECLRDNNKENFKKLLHLNSHGKLSDMESKELALEDKALFAEVFSQFLEDYRWGDS